MKINRFHVRRQNRRSFLSLGAAGAAWLLGCAGNVRSDSKDKFDGEVIIIGAGAAGMTTAHLLQQRGIDFQVLEAAALAGGRIKHNLDFTDFPIPLGAEWVHVEAQILKEILNDPSVDVTTQLRGYDPAAQAGYFEDGTLELLPNIAFQSDFKFVGSSWLDFFGTYLLPGISDGIIYNTQVVAIDYTGDRINVTDASGTTRTADRVVVTVPLKILQRGDIRFKPELNRSKRKVIDQANVWSGLKVFIEFDRQFYPSFLSFPDSETANGQRLYYDAAYGQQTMSNVLGLFAVGRQAERYQALSKEDLLRRILSELDAVFGGMATRSYLRHIVQDWNAEPFIGSAYLADVEASGTSRHLSESVAQRVYFAGEAYTSFNDWGGVHTATRSAAEVVNEILG